MQVLNVLGDLKRALVTHLTPDYLIEKFGLSRPAAASMLRRLHRHGLVRKLRQGLYYNDFAAQPPHKWLHHLALVPDSVVTFEAGMHLNHLIEQVPHVVTCARWLGPDLRIENDFGVYEFTRMPRSLIFDFAQVDFMRLASPEKAYLDHLWLCKNLGCRPRTATLHLDTFRPDVFFRYAAKMGLDVDLPALGLDDPAKWPSLVPQGG